MEKPCDQSGMEALADDVAGPQTFADPGRSRHRALAPKAVVEVLGTMVPRTPQDRQTDEPLGSNSATLAQYIDFEGSGQVVGRDRACTKSKESSEVLDQTHEGQGVENVVAPHGRCKASPLNRFEVCASLEESLHGTGFAKVVDRGVSQTSRQEDDRKFPAQDDVQSMAFVGG